MAIDLLKKAVSVPVAVGAASVGKIGNRALKAYDQAKKIFGPIGCPWCYQLVPRSQIDAHLLLHRNDHHFCDLKRLLLEGLLIGKKRARANAKARLKLAARKSSAKKSKVRAKE